MKQLQVPTDKDMNAIGEVDPTFRFTFSNDDLSEYHKGFVNWHKQPTIEISVVCEGAVDVYVLNLKKTVIAGDGFCVMPGCLHSICSTEQQKNAKYFTMVFHPEILYGYHGSYFENAYYRPFADGGIPLFLFHRQNVWTTEIFAKLEWIAEHCFERWDAIPPIASPPEVRLEIQHYLQEIWVQFAKHLSQEKGDTPFTNTKKIYSMIDYLHEHYTEKFSLTALADSVFMSRNECCRYFKQAMHMTITEYLLEYRLSKAAELLETSGLSITEISEQTGFCDVSYFIKMFRQKKGITPKTYAQKVGGSTSFMV